MPTSAVTTTSTSSTCLECGTIQKSGKLSCCARGGSWFGNCGSAANANDRGHTWYDGIRACKARQSKAAVYQQLQVSQPKSNVSSSDANMGIGPEPIIAASYSFALSVANISTLIPVATPVTVPTNSPIIMPYPKPTAKTIQSSSTDMFMASSSLHVACLLLQDATSDPPEQHRGRQH